MSVFRSRGGRASIITALCALLVALAGCSALRIGYSTAPDLVYWWLDGYVDLSGTQSAKVRGAIAQWFAWNRREQLPAVAALLARASTEVLSDITPARACEWQAELTGQAQVAFEHIVPAAAELIPTLTARQLRHVEARYAKSNDDFREEFQQGEPGRRAQANLKRTVERAESLYGRLDDAQRARIAAGLARSPFDADLWMAERLQRQQDALALLRRFSAPGIGRDQAQAALLAYARGIERSPREPYRRYTQQLQEFNCGLAASLHNATTPAQRREAADRLKGWDSDLRAIANAREPANGSSN